MTIPPGQQVRAIYCHGAVQLTAQAVETRLELGIDVACFPPPGGPLRHTCPAGTAAGTIRPEDRPHPSPTQARPPHATMTPFHTRFPDLAARETRCAHVVTPGGPLPLGEYAFVEFYCDDPRCDCRRVGLQVTTPQAPRMPLATINYGWESPEFYTRWTHGDAEAGNEITQASLDPINRQSKYAHHLLKLFQEQFMTDPAYVARLARHYELFKGIQRQPAEPLPPASLSAPAGLPQAPLTVDGILQQLRHVPDQADFAPYEADRPKPSCM